MLTACPNGLEPIAGDYNLSQSSSPVEVSESLCYEGSISIDSNQPITVNAELISTTGSINLSSDDSLTVNMPIVSDAEGITLDADDQIIIGAVLQAAGEIEITSHKSIDVTAGIVSSGGEVTLEAVHKRLNFGISALDQLQDLLTLGSGQLAVTIGGESDEVLISGAEGVSITAEAGINDKYNIGGNTYFKNIAPVVMEILEKPDLFTLPVSVQVWNPKAEVTTQNAKLVSEGGEVVVSAIAEANAKGKAVWNRVIGTGEEAGEGLGFDKGGGAAGLFFTDATATVDVLDTIISGDGVEVSSEVKNEIELEVNAMTNNGLSNTNPSSVAIGFGLTDMRTTSTVHVDENSLISSTGNVTVEATGEDDNSNSVKASAYRDGVVGAAVGFTYTDGTVSAVVDGEITMSPETASEESGTAAEELDFNPALQVDFANSSLQFTGTTEYQTGDAVLFTSADSGTIPGLIPGTVYYLIVTSDTTNESYELQFASSAEDAENNEPIAFGSAFPTLTNERLNLTAPITITAIDSNQRHLILFGYDQWLDGQALFDNNDPVTFTTAEDRFLGYNDADGNLIGPLPEANYTVSIVDSPFPEQYPLAIELIDDSGQPVALNGASYLQSTAGTLYPISTFNTTENSVDLSILSIDSSTNEVVSTPPSIPVQQGEALEFYAGLNSTITTLVEGVTYYAIVDTSNEGIIQLAETISQADSSNPAIQTAQASLTFEQNGETVEIPIGNFEMGLGLTFSEDPNIPDGSEVTYHAVTQKPINGLINQAKYSAYNVNNVNSNPAVPQYIVALIQLDAVNLSTTADSGNFTLEVTDPEGGKGTTGPIAWDATASDLAAAIDALQLPGVSVAVSGFGTPQAPWLIEGLSVNDILVTSQLFEGSSSVTASSQQAEMGTLLGSDAVSGTFTLTYTDSSDQAHTTTSLAWDATPDQLAAALNALPNLSVSVTGMGNALSPWRIEGLLPSQVTVDSTALVNSFDQEATMQMTADLQAAFWNGQTLQWNSDEFTITGANVDDNTLTTQLSDEASVVSANGSGLENGSVSFSAVDAGATQMFSFADSGTFTLTITNPRTGTTSTTGTIAWDADAATVASAISSSSGISVDVLGSGSIQSPWLINGVGAEQLEVNSDKLLRGTNQTNILYRSTTSGATVISTDATGGTFTLTFSAGGETIESNPIAYDATAGELTDVLRGSSSSLSAEVFGRGTASEPWVILGFAQPIESGDELIFHDSWELPSLGLVSGKTYYAVVNPQALDADMLILGLADSPADAMADPPVLVTLAPSLDLITGPSTIMTGAEESIAPVPEALELEISTELESSDSGTASSAIGGRPMLGYYVDGAKSSKSRWFSKKKDDAPSAIDHEITERTPDPLKKKVNRFSATFGVSILDVKNDVQSIVGHTAIIGVEGDVSIKSDLTENIHASANAGLAKQSNKDHRESSAVAVATVVATLDNSSQAVIESDATVTGTEGVDVVSEITYPKRDSIPGAGGGGWDEAYGIIKSLALNPTVNAVESWFFNTSTNVGIKGVGSDDEQRLSWILTGSVIVQDITNNNLAQIADGAQINQGTSSFSWYDAATESMIQTDLGELEESNGVTIEATSDLTQWGIAGELYIGIDLITLGSTDFANNILPFQKSSRNAFGGSANFVIISEHTQALLGGVDPDGNVPQNPSTNVKYGNGEDGVGLSVRAETTTELIEIGQSAANSSGFGIEASTSYLLMGENEDGDQDRGQFTYAELNSENVAIDLTSVTDSAGAIVVEAADSSDLWAVSGAVLLGATKGIGLSASVIELNRDAAAGVGSRTSKTTPKTTNRKQNGSDFTIESSLDGTIMPMSLVGAISADRHDSIREDVSDEAPAEDEVPAEDPGNGASEITGSWGLGISGDFAGAFIHDQSHAYLNSPGTISGIESTGTELGALEVSATNESIINPIAGQATIAIARGDEGSMAGLAGSASVALVESNVTATLENATIEYLSIDLGARNEKRIGSCAAGLQVQAPKGADLQVAGSVVVNEIENTTVASITDVGSEGLGEISLSALQLDEIWGGAGTAAVTYDRRSDRPRAKTAVGVGMSAVWNQIHNTTTAEVVDTNLNQSEGAVDVTAEDFTSSRVVSAGVDVTVPAGTAIEIGGMWSTNYVSPSTTAQITGSTIENLLTDDSLSVVAVVAPFLDSFAGYFSLEFGKPFSTKETQLGIGVGAAVAVTRLGPKDPNGTALPTLAQISASTINRSGDVTVRAFSGALDDQTVAFVPNQDLADSLVGELSLHALAIAGSAQGENSAEAGFAGGAVVNGAVVVTDLMINTNAMVTNNSFINAETSTSEVKSVMEVLATNQLTVSTDAGGASASESVAASGSSVDIAVGGADNSFSSSNETSATIAGSSAVVAESLDVVALHAPQIDHVAFGVAVSVDVSVSMFGAALGFSGAFLQSDQTDSVSAGISDSVVTVADTMNVQSDDQSKMTTKSGAGSLQVAYGSGGSVALAPSAVTNKVTVGNQVLAWIGQQPSTDTLVDASVTADDSSVRADGGITVQATSNQEIANTAIAVAVSVAIAPDFASAAGSGAGASSTITTDNIIKAAVNGVSDFTAGGANGLSVTATDSGSRDITVGSAAASVGWFGASIGISLAEITNNDQVAAEVQNSTIQTNGTGSTGTPVEIIATDSVQLSTYAVATSLSISIGASGAGGKSNIASHAKVAASLGDGSQVTTAPGATPGNLTIQATSSETLESQIFGGSLGLGSIGVFKSDAAIDGSTETTLDTSAELEVNDLSVIASSDHTVTSQGMSVTVGGLAGTGERHGVAIHDEVTTAVSGQSTQWNVAGNLLFQATAGNNVVAQTSGSGDNGESISASLMGVGFFKVDSAVAPVVDLSVTDVKLDVAGTSQFESDATTQNRTQAKSGSGSLVGGDAAKATTANDPMVALTLTGLDLTSGKTTIAATSQADYSTNANSVYATVAGGSAARAKNHSTPQVNVTLGTDTSITADASVSVSSDNLISGIGDGFSQKAAGFMARVGAGGGVTGFGGTSESTMKASSGIKVNDGVQITAVGPGSNIEIGSSNQWQSNQLTHLGTGGAINGAGIQSTLESNLTNTVDIGSDVQLIAPRGQIGIGTNNSSVTTSNADSYTFGLAGGSSSDSSNQMTSMQTLTIGDSSVLHAGKDIVVTTGYNPLTQTESLLDAYAIVTARCAGLLEIPSTTADAELSATNTLNIASGSSIISHADVEIGALPGINNASWYTFANIDGAKGKVHQGSDGLTESNAVTIDGEVIAGNMNQLTVEIPTSDDGTYQITVNDTVNQAISSETTTIAPDQAFSTTNAFLPFQTSFNAQYDATQLLNGLDVTSRAILKPSISTEDVPAITLTNLGALGGQVVLHAADLQGGANITANLPNISITNQSDAYLLLDGVGAANTHNMGQVNIVGGAAKPTGMTFNEDDGVPTIVVLQTYPDPVGNSESGPAIAVNDAIVNTAGSVQITNDEGALVQIAPINAQTISINTPNSAYIVSTPADYYGSSGEIKDYWTAGTSLVQDGTFESPSTSDFSYNPTGSAWVFDPSSGVSANDSGFTANNPPAPQGKQVAFLQEKGEMSQLIAGMTAGESYVIQFEAAQREGYDQQSFTIDLDGEQLCEITPTTIYYQTYRCSFVAQAKELADVDSLLLTDGFNDDASAFWHQDQVEFPTSGTMTIDFTYQAGGARAADGIALAFQIEGLDAIGRDGGWLGYVGISGPTAAYQINLYEGHVQGSNFVTTNTSQNYLETTPVSFNSGNPVQVQLVYDVDAKTVTETLTDTITDNTFTRTYDNIDLSSVLGAKAYVGFTGGDGGATSTQTVTDFSLTMSNSGSSPLIDGFGSWQINGSRLLTLTGLEPSGQDETVFLDNFVLSTNPEGFTPGLNSYVEDYTANLAATTAANVLHLDQSGTETTEDFSAWLYNTGGQNINVNYNVAPGDYGDNYPRKAGDNYDQTQHGSGIIFFGSEIPYLWDSVTPVSSGSGNLYSGLGYLDNLSNAQTYSVDASGNADDENRNVTQGTGPQHDNVSPGRGIFPVVPSHFPTSVSVSDPASRSLGGTGINAGSLDVTALYLDINGPINVGAVNQTINVVLGSDMQQQLDDYQQDYRNGTESSSTLNLDSYFGTSGITGHFDASSGEIVLDTFAVKAGITEAVFTGAIISTTDSGEINVRSNPGDVEIKNNTDYPLVLQSISANSRELSGLVFFNDTITDQSTVYVYSPEEELRVYHGDFNASLDSMTLEASLESMTLVDQSDGDSASFQPGSEKSYEEESVSSTSMTYQWTTDAWISRELTFKNENGSYELNPASTSDSWVWGRLSEGNSPTEVESDPFPSTKTVLLSDGQTDDSNAYWHPNKIDIPKTGSFTVSFTYQASGDRAADGITFAFQNEGANAIGGDGGALGYVGITGPTAAYQINLYDGHVQGSNFVTTNTSGTYLNTGGVDFNSGNPIEVKLVYDAAAKTIQENLTDSVTGTTYTHTYDNIDLTSVLGDSSYIGFTGGDGGATSIQTASDFSMTVGSTSLSDFAFWNGLYHQKVVNLGDAAAASNDALQSVTAVITQSESATTTFDDSNSSAWNYGPSTTWDWTYPTEILLRNFYQVPAANPISIDFSGVEYGSLEVESESDLELTGNIFFPGDISLSSEGDLTQVSNAIIAGNQIELTSNGGSIGQESSPIEINADSSRSINFNASSDIYVSSQGDLTIGNIVASSGQVKLQSGGDISAGGSGANIAGDSISLHADGGSIGSQSEPLTIQTKTSQLESGTVIDGLLTATAQDGVFVVQPDGDLRLLSVTTTSPLGVVSITTEDGNITDGNTSDLFRLNQFTREQAETLIEQIKNVQQNSADDTVTAFEASVDQNYLQYWTLLQPTNGTYDEQTGEIVLTDNGISYYQTQANLYYTEQSGSETEVTATPEQVQAYANILYQNSVAVFEDSFVFGDDWNSQPQFQAYDPKYIFTAPDDVVDELSYGATDLSNSFAMLSLAALGPEGTAIVGPVNPAVTTTVLNLNATGSIGLPFHVIEIDYSDLQQGTLTGQERAILTQATAAGELRIIGVNPSGQRVVYPSGSRPDDVTPVAILVRIDKPIFVDLAENGLAQLQAEGSINLTEAVGDLNILYAETSDSSKLVSQANVFDIALNGSASTEGWSIDANGVLGYTDSTLVYTPTDFTIDSPLYSTGIIGNGSFEQPVQSANSFSYTPDAPNWSFIGLAGIAANNSGFTQENSNAPLGSQVAFIQEQGSMSQQIDGLVTGQAYSLQFDVAQRAGYAVPTFTVDLDSHLLTTQTPTSTDYETITVPFVLETTSLELTDGQDDEANAYWYQTPLLISDAGQFTVEFTYQAGGDALADGITFAFQKEGTDALGGDGGSLGYVGITGPTAAYQINLYDGHQRGSNFVTTNTSEIYLPTDLINFNSGDKIKVQLVFDADQQTVTETLTDTVQQTSFTRTYDGIDLATLLQENAYIGFTGGDGGASSTQNITDFKLFRGDQSDSPVISGFGGWKYTGTHTLTFTGVDASSVDQTALVDAVKITRAPGILSGDLRVVAGGAIGADSNPLSVQVGGKLDLFATADLTLTHQSSNNLRLNAVYAGGDATIDAPVANIFAVQNYFKGSIGGFGNDGEGAGWSSDAVNGSTTFVDNSLSLQNDAAPTDAPSTWYSTAATLYETPVTVEDRFISSFIYTSDDYNSDLRFVLTSADTDSTTLTQTIESNTPNTFALVIDNPCDGCSKPSTIGVAYDGQTQSTPVPDELGISSGDQIEVLMIYESITRSASVTLTNAGNSFTFELPGLDLIKILGSNRARVGFMAQGDGQTSTQEITGFSFAYGSPTLETNELTLTSDGQIGAAQTPILILALGGVTASAPNGVYLTQIRGDLLIESATSSGTVQLSAPTGSVLTNDTASSSDALVILAAESEATLSDPLHVSAQDLAIMSLKNIGQPSNALQLQVSHLSATATLGDIHLGQTGNLMVTEPLQAGGTVRLLGDSTIKFDAQVVAEGDVHLRSESDAGMLQFLAGAHLLSNQGSIYLHADRSLTTEIGSVLEGATGAFLSGGAAELGTDETHRMRLLGSVRGGPLHMTSAVASDSLHVAISDWTGISGSPLEAIVGGFSMLHLDDSRANAGRNYVANGGRIESEIANVELGELQSLTMDLGSASDSFRTATDWQMNSLDITDAGGANQFEFAGVAGGSPQAVSLTGGSELEQLMIDGNGTPIWLVDGIVHLGDFVIQHTGIEKLFVENELSTLRPEIENAIEIQHEEFPNNTLTMVGTGGNDDLYIDLGLPSVSLIGLWNEIHELRREFKTQDFDALRFMLLDGDDSLLVDGVGSLDLFIEGGDGGDWIRVNTDSNTSVIDLSGNNFITTATGSDEIRTGPGRDKVDAGDGINQLHDSGGENWLFTGNQDDQIYHENPNDLISAGNGINQIWLNGSLVDWHNQVIRADVNRDKLVTALDALLVINLLNQSQEIYFEGSPDSIDYLYDTTNDGYVSPRDILIVINDMTRQAGMEGEYIGGPQRPSRQFNERQLASDEVFSNWSTSFEEIETSDKDGIFQFDGVGYRPGDEYQSPPLEADFTRDIDELIDTFESIRRAEMNEKMEAHFQALGIGLGDR